MLGSETISKGTFTTCAVWSDSCDRTDLHLSKTALNVVVIFGG